MTDRELKARLKQLLGEYWQSNDFGLSAQIDSLRILLEASSIVAIALKEGGVKGDAVVVFKEVLGAMSDVYNLENLATRDVH